MANVALVEKLTLAAAVAAAMMVAKYPAASSLDLLGRKRIVGKRLDVGCVAGKPSGLTFSVR